MSPVCVSHLLLEAEACGLCLWEAIQRRHSRGWPVPGPRRAFVFPSPVENHLLDPQSQNVASFPSHPVWRTFYLRPATLPVLELGTEKMPKPKKKKKKKSYPRERVTPWAPLEFLGELDFRCPSRDRLTHGPQHDVRILIPGTCECYLVCYTLQM